MENDMIRTAIFPGRYVRGRNALKRLDKEFWWCHVKKLGRAQICDRHGRPNIFELTDCDGLLRMTRHYRDHAELCRRRLNADRAQSPGNRPVKEPPNEPIKPPVKEPGENPDPPPPPNRPPVQEPPNEPGQSPVKEPPPKDPNRKPPGKTPMRVASVKTSHSVFLNMAL